MYYELLMRCSGKINFLQRPEEDCGSSLEEGLIEDSDDMHSTFIQEPVLVVIKEKEPPVKNRPVLKTAAKCSLEEFENEDVPPKQRKLIESSAAVSTDADNSSG